MAIPAAKNLFAAVVIIALLFTGACGDDPDADPPTLQYDAASVDLSDELAAFDEQFRDAHQVRYSAPFAQGTSILNDTSRTGIGAPLNIEGDHRITDDGGLQIQGRGPDEPGGIATPGDDASLPAKLADTITDGDFTAEFFVHTGQLTIHGGVQAPARVLALGEGIANNTLLGGFHERIEGELEVQFRLPDSHFEHTGHISSAAVDHDAYHHVAFVYEPRPNTAALYVDGDLVSTTLRRRLGDGELEEIADYEVPEDLFGAVAEGDIFVLGNAPRSTRRYFSGIIYHVAIHDEARDNQEIAAMNEIHRHRYCPSPDC